jgi:hypothetical protein
MYYAHIHIQTNVGVATTTFGNEVRRPIFGQSTEGYHRDSLSPYAYHHESHKSPNHVDQ